MLIYIFKHIFNVLSAPYALSQHEQVRQNALLAFGMGTIMK